MAKRSKVRVSVDLIADGSYQDNVEFSKRDIQLMLIGTHIAAPNNIKLKQKLRRLIKRWNEELA